MDNLPPLVVDLDDTLVFTDTLHENLINFIKTNPLKVFNAFSLLKNKAEFKKYIYKNSFIDVATLPYNQELIKFIQEERNKGRVTILATAAYKGIAEQVAQFLGCFDKVISTDGSNNLKGKNKLEAVKQDIGSEFIYAGDHEVDITIWEASKGAIIVGKNVENITKTLQRKNIHIVKQFEKPEPSLKIWLKAIRIHQWLKNLLLFLPILTAFQIFDLNKISNVFIGFLSFSLGASATYILNDLWDLSNDRQHKRKSKRPFAAGIISIPSAIKMTFILLGLALILAISINVIFLGLFILYLIITTLYSLKFKKEPLLDITILSILYTMRIFAGGAVAGIELSYWLISFSIFIFLSLATMKRCAEIVAMKQDKIEKIVGRGYAKADLDILWPLGISAYIGAIILFGLYINEPNVMLHYAQPSILWAVQLLLFYLIGKLWIKTKHGLMHDDPIVYIIRDKKSLKIIIVSIILFLISYYEI